MAIPTRAELDSLIHNHLATDPGFRDVLLADPRTAVAGLLGVKLPDFVTVEVHEESLSHVHLVIPAQTSAGEICDKDLELVAGGAACWSDSCTSGP